MIFEFKEIDKSTLVEIIGLGNISVDRYIDLYKNIAENPLLDGFLGYLKDRGMIVKIIKPTEIKFPDNY